MNALINSTILGWQARLIGNEIVQSTRRTIQRWKGIQPRINYKIAHALGMWILRSYQRLFSIQMNVTGLENVPEGAKILAANHPNLSDSYLLPLLFDGRVRILAQASQFRAPILGWIFTHTGQIPVHADRRQAAYQLACQALANGNTLLVYPEGRLNPDNETIKCCSGTIRIALTSSAPIIPIGIHVNKHNLVKVSGKSIPVSKRKLWQVRGSFCVQFGEAFRIHTNFASTRTQTGVHALTSELMKKINQLRQEAEKESES